MELERLIAIEQLNDELVQSARREAAEIVAAARASAQQREMALSAAVEQLIRDGEAAIDAERIRRAAEILEHSKDAVARYDAVGDEQIARIVPGLIDHLVAPGEPA